MEDTTISKTSAQQIAEIMVRREAAKQKIVLPLKFWNNEPWKKKYKSQIIAANGLLKLYEPAAILNALKRKECSWQYSLRIKGMNDIFKEEQAKLDNLKIAAQESERTFSQATTTEVKKFGKESKLNKLRD
jgi:hypothetical protein